MREGPEEEPGHHEHAERPEESAVERVVCVQPPPDAPRNDADESTEHDDIEDQSTRTGFRRHLDVGVVRSRLKIEQIRDQVGSCTYLTSSVPDENGTISVTLNGSELVFDASGERGWNWVERKNGEIVLTNEACALAQLGDARVEARLTCAER